MDRQALNAALEQIEIMIDRKRENTIERKRDIMKEAHIDQLMK